MKGLQKDQKKLEIANNLLKSGIESEVVPKNIGLNYINYLKTLF